MDPQDAIAVFALTAFAATAQAVTGFGFGLLIIPPLVILLGPTEAVVLSTVLGTSLSLLMFLRLHALVAWRPLTVAVIGSVLGAPFGLLILVTLDKDILQVFIALAVLVATYALWRGVQVRADPTIGPLASGFIAGITRMAAGLPGPPVVIYFTATRLAPDIQRAVVTTFFAATGLVGIALFGAEGSLDMPLLGVALAGAPGIALGWLAGNHLFSRIDERLFAALIYILLVGSALLAILTAIT